MSCPNHSHIASVRNAFDLLARSHDAFISSADDAGYSQNVLACLQPYIDQVKNDDWILDIGCGSGQWSQKVMQACERVHAFDLSYQMTAYAHQKNADLPVFQMDAEEMGLAPGTYSFLLAIGDILSYASNIDRMLSEARRIAQPGAMLVGTVISTGGILIQELLNGQINAVNALLYSGIWVERSSQELQVTACQPAQTVGKLAIPPLTIHSFTCDRLNTVLKRNNWLPREIKGIGVLRRLSGGKLDYTVDKHIMLESILRETSPWLEISTNLFFAAQLGAF